MNYVINAMALVLLYALAGCQQETGKKNVNLTATEVTQLLASDRQVVVLDVRTPQEYREGHLAGAVNINYLAPDFEQQIAKLDTAATYLLYCRSGNRSSKATATMARSNFSNLYNATAGFSELRSAGLRTE